MIKTELITALKNNLYCILSLRTAKGVDSKFCKGDLRRKACFQNLLWRIEEFLGGVGTLVPFEQFKKREKHPQWSAEACNFTKTKTPPWVFFTFFELYKW